MDNKFENKLQRNFYLYGLFILLIYFPVFLHLDVLPIRIWDEARLATNAIEMYNNHDFIVTHFKGEADMWNTKPPLMIWLQVLSLHLFGINELAIRFPSAAATLLTCFCLLVFSIRYLKSFWFGCIASLVLITSQGYINHHVVRNGDYDALMIMFIVAFVLYYVAFLETKKLKYLHWFFLCLTLSILTKGIAAMMFAPALLIYTLIKKQLKDILNKWFFIDAVALLAVVFGYYFLRESQNPGYLDAVWLNELGGRYLSTIEQHDAGFWYYYDLIVDQHFQPWYWMLPCAAVVGLYSIDTQIKNITLLSMICIISYWLIISLAQTKLEWYEAPLYPFMSLLAAVFLYQLFLWIEKLYVFKDLVRINLAPFLFLFIVFLQPYQKIIAKVYFPKLNEFDHDFYELSRFMKENAGKEKSEVDFNICYLDYNAHISFYTDKMNMNDVSIEFKDWTKLQGGEKIVIGQDSLRNYIESKYKFEVLNYRGVVRKYQILGAKEDVKR
jgi:4-amino-4-deoxy-L-arabinose transferase-like glycosyltransferase